MTDKKSITIEKALQICEDIRDRKKVMILSQCWGCMKYSKGDPEKMCFYNPPSNRGCKKINKEFDRDTR